MTCYSYNECKCGHTFCNSETKVADSVEKTLTCPKCGNQDGIKEVIACDFKKRFPLQKGWRRFFFMP